ncbi:hypothetical protein ACFLSV_03400 [Bacteroidota bacterium]
MLLSEATNELIFDLKEYSTDNIKNVEDLSRIIDLTYSNNNEKEFKEIIFQSKYLKGLKNVLGKNIDDENTIVKLTDEFKSNLEKLSSKISSIIEQTDKELAHTFKNKYFNFTQECMANYMSLIDDFSICKNYFNDKKYNSDNK